MTLKQLATYNSVSYTHLDVYKRQDYKERETPRLKRLLTQGQHMADAGYMLSLIHILQGA